ncbi:MAG: DUF4197 domain-containing protein [Deltaproteobacteria bacterium HGW-Deltaproteobacteria-4]|nr:MAG: DUF4197 domain-containing protein [Deltaproteobacteria bacterium HGW-Deltaproteobacteria-4]
MISRLNSPFRLGLALLLLTGGLTACTEVELQRALANLPPTLNQPAALSTADIAAGLKEALRIGSERVVTQVGRTDGFNADPAIHIPLPQKLADARNVLAMVGLNGVLDDLETRCNRAAEAAAPQAKALFWQSIRAMTLDDARAIFNGPKDAATRYFQGKMTPELIITMRPVIDDSLAQVGAVRLYQQAVAKVETLPFTPSIKVDLTGYVVGKTTDGLFHYLAVEEAAIRQNPVKRTTELLQRVFSGT